jgi:hypothetical protein
MWSLHSHNLQNVDQTYPDATGEVPLQPPKPTAKRMGEEGLEPPTSCV